MTLRVDIEIVPYGVEENRRKIYRLNISNIGLVKDLGFGHEVCRYKVELLGKTIDIPGFLVVDEWEVIDVDFIEEHDRRDGAVALVAAAAELMKVKA